MRSLWESGLRHVLAGESTLEELLRVTDVPRRAGALAGPGGSRRPARPSRPALAAAARSARRRGAGGRPAGGARPLEFHGPGLLDEAASGSAGAGRAAAGTTVLLVEDEESCAGSCGTCSSARATRWRRRGTACRRWIRWTGIAPDIIILDLNLPGLDGYSVLSQLRSRPATRNIPVVVLTAKGDEDNEVRVFELGADDFITKPFRARALSARLEAVLGRHRA